MDQEISGNSVRNFRGSSRGTPLFPFGTENREIPNPFAHFSCSQSPRKESRAVRFWRFAAMSLGMSSGDMNQCSFCGLRSMTSEFLLNRKCFEAGSGKWLLPYE